MNKKKRIAILFAVIIVVTVGIIIAVTSHQKKEMNFDEFANRFEKSAEEVLGEDVRKVSKTELAATLTYGDQMMIQDWPGALYKKDDTAFLCWTYSPEVTYILEYTPSKIDDSEIIKMAESAEPVK